MLDVRTVGVSLCRDFDQLPIVGLCLFLVIGEFGGAPGPVETIEAVWASLQGSFVCCQSLPGPLQFKEHIGHTLARTEAAFYPA